MAKSAKIDLVAELFASLEDFSRAEALMEEIYDGNVYFQDPIQRVDGLKAFQEMNRRVVEKMPGLEVRVLGVTGNDQAVAAEWDMSFNTLGRRVHLPGVSWLSFNAAGKCYRHVDYWDWMALSDQVVPAMKFMHDIMRKAVG